MPTDQANAENTVIGGTISSRKTNGIGTGIDCRGSSVVTVSNITFAGFNSASGCMQDSLMPQLSATGAVYVGGDGKCTLENVDIRGIHSLLGEDFPNQIRSGLAIHAAENGYILVKGGFVNQVDFIYGFNSSHKYGYGGAICAEDQSVIEIDGLRFGENFPYMDSLSPGLVECAENAKINIKDGYFPAKATLHAYEPEEPDEPKTAFITISGGFFGYDVKQAVQDDKFLLAAGSYVVDITQETQYQGEVAEGYICAVFDDAYQVVAGNPVYDCSAISESDDFTFENARFNLTPTYSYAPATGGTPVAGLPTDAGDYIVYIAYPEKTQGHYWVPANTGQFNITISPYDITGKSFSLASGSKTSMEYTGKPFTPTIKGIIVDGFNVTYASLALQAQTNAGRYGLTINGTGNFTGSLSFDWAITPKDISGANVILSDTEFTYNVEEQTVSVTGVTLSGYKDITYQVKGDLSGTDAKEYTVTVTGTGNYAGSVERKWVIHRAHWSSVTFTVNDIYYGQSLERDFEYNTVIAGASLNGHSVGGWQAVCETQGLLHKGQHSIRINTHPIGGNKNFEGEIHLAFNVISLPVDVTLTMNGEALPSKVPYSPNGYTISAEFSKDMLSAYEKDIIGDNAGTVSFTLKAGSVSGNTVTLSKNNTSGVSQITLKNSGTYSFSIAISFSGGKEWYPTLGNEIGNSGDYKINILNGNFTIDKQINTSLAVTDDNGNKIGGSAAFTVNKNGKMTLHLKLSAGSGTLESGLTITFKIGSSSVTAKYDGKSSYSADYEINGVGSYTITVTTPETVVAPSPQTVKIQWLSASGAWSHDQTNTYLGGSTYWGKNGVVFQASSGYSLSAGLTNFSANVTAPKAGQFTFYYKNAQNQVGSATVTVNLDKTAPTLSLGDGKGTDYTDKAGEKGVRFFLYSGTLAVIPAYSDDQSKVKTVEYAFGDKTGAKTAYKSFSGGNIALDPTYTVLYVRVTDNVGNVTEVTGTFMAYTPLNDVTGAYTKLSGNGAAIGLQGYTFLGITGANISSSDYQLQSSGILLLSSFLDEIAMSGDAEAFRFTVSYLPAGISSWSEVKNQSAKPEFVFSLDVEKAALTKSDVSLTINAHGGEFKYDGTPYTVTVTSSAAKPVTFRIDYAAKTRAAGDPINAGTYTIMLTAESDYFKTVTFTDASWTFTILPRDVTVTIDDLSSVYGDATKALTAQESGDYIVEKDKNSVYELECSVTNTSGAGSYAIKGKDLNNANYNVTFANEGEYIVKKAVLTDGTQAVNAEYDGQTHKIAVSLSGFKNGDTLANGVTIEYSKDGKNWSANEIGIVNVSDSTDVYYRIVFDNYETVKGQAGLNVTARDIADAVITVGGSYEYNGSAHTPDETALSLKDGNIPIGTDDVTVAGYSDNTDAGTAHVTVNGTGNYTGSVTVDFVIAKARLSKDSFEYRAPVGLEYDGTEKNAHVQFIGAGTLGAFAVEYSSATAFNAVSPVNAGTYYVFVNVTGGKNYEDGRIYLEVSFSVTPKNVTVEWTVDGNAWIGGGEFKPGGYTVSVSTRDILAQDGVTLVLQANPAGVSASGLSVTLENVGAYTLTVSLSGNDLGNYALVGPVDQTFAIAKQIINAELGIFLENGKAVSGSVIFTVNANGEMIVRFELTGKGGAALPNSLRVIFLVGKNGKEEELTGVYQNGKYVAEYKIEEVGDYVVSVKEIVDTSGEYGFDTVNEQNFTVEWLAIKDGDWTSDGYYDGTDYWGRNEVSFLAGQGFEISESFTGWTSSVTADAGSDAFVFYIKNANGEVARVQTEVMLDGEAPEGSVGDGADADLYTDTDAPGVKFWMYEGTLNAYITAADAKSGVAKIEYAFGSADAEPQAYSEYLSGVSLDPRYNVLYVKITDKVGNVTKITASFYCYTAMRDQTAGYEKLTGNGAATALGGNTVVSVSGNAVSTGDYKVDADTLTLLSAYLDELQMQGDVSVFEFTVAYNPAGILQENMKNPSAFTFQFVLDVEKATLSPDDLVFSVADHDGSMKYDGTAYLSALAGTTIQEEGLFTFYYNGNSEAINAGTYTVTADFAGSNYYKSVQGLSDSGWKFTIEKREITVTVDSVSSKYGEQPEELTAQVSGDGIVNGDTVYILSCDVTKDSNVGKYDVTGNVISENYAVTFANGTGAYEVTPRRITVTIDSVTGMYGENPENLTAQMSGDGIINGDTVYTLSCDVTNSTGVGVYDITGTSVNKNYEVTFANGMDAYEVTARKITVSIQNAASGYGRPQAPLNAKVTSGSIVNGDTPYLLECAVDESSARGFYDITGKNTDSNYDITFEGGIQAYEVTKAVLSDQTDSVSVEYDGQTHKITVTLAGFVNGESIADALRIEYSTDGKIWSVNEIEATNVADSKSVWYRVTFNNYDTVEGRVELNVEARHISKDTVITVTGTYIYTGKAQDAGFTVSNALLTQNDYDVSYENNVNAGTAKIVLTGTGNFTGTVEQIFEIGKANGLHATADDVHAVYDGCAHGLVITIGGFVNGEDQSSASGYKIEYSLDGKNWSDNELTVTNVADSKTVYFRISYTNYEEMIGNADIEVTARDISDLSLSINGSFIYNGKPHEPSFTVTGIASSDGDFTVAYVDNTNAGTAKIIVTGQGNCTGVIEQTFVIAKAPLSLQLEINGWKAGESASLPVLNGNLGDGSVTYRYTGTTANGKAYDSAEAPAEAGDYTLIVTIGETDNYMGGTAKVGFTITGSGSSFNWLIVVLIALIVLDLVLLGIVIGMILRRREQNEEPQK